MHYVFAKLIPIEWQIRWSANIKVEVYLKILTHWQRGDALGKTIFDWSFICMSFWPSSCGQGHLTRAIAREIVETIWCATQSDFNWLSQVRDWFVRRLAKVYISGRLADLSFVGYKHVTEHARFLNSIFYVIWIIFKTISLILNVTLI